MRYLTAEDVLVLHAFVIDETSGSHGLRDIRLLESAVHKPQTKFAGKDLYLGMFKKAAVLLEALANYHVFIDGNKRTAFVATARFLTVNRYELTTSNEAVEKTVLAVATKEMNIEELVTWLKDNTRKKR